ncbi:uncharacterized protein LOC124177170 isoform X1 [Neodiprion fabricii]|uniref:uncharacterized protein LOC124177170 isoform X1 n=1 Tax=Neodiprion fabricii TaxID=2872261 RepID=UPI001ED91CF7|nr:uncharacterized protein LOC124177170 isoform X1 [Neodiprion fabricii]
MALSSELLLRLDADAEPLPKRLKLAENAFCSTDLPINHKEDLIVKWLCKVAPTELIVWKSLRLCVYCQTDNRTTLNLETKTKLVETLTNQLNFKEENIPDEMLDCCIWILTNPKMQHYFQNVLSKFGRFLQCLLIRIRVENFKQAATNDDVPDRSSLVLSEVRQACVLNSIDSLIQVHKHHSDKNQVAETFLDYVLSPLCALIDPTCTDNSNRIGAETHKCIQQILFGKARYNEYKEYSSGIGNGCLPVKLFTTLTQLLAKMGSDDVSVMLSYVFRAAVGSYKTDGELIDSFFRSFVNSAGNLKTVVSNYLINYLTDIHLEFGNKIDNLTLMEFLTSLIDEILSKEERLSRKDYDLLRNVTNLNPLVVESKLPTIFRRILLEARSSRSEEQSYVMFLISAVDASSRLRREQKLIPWLLLALNTALQENKKSCLLPAEVFPTHFTSKFTSLASGLHSPQVTAMLKSLSYHLKSNCVDEFNINSAGQVTLMTECTVLLMVSFFNGIRIFEHNIPLPMQKKFTSALSELGDILSTLSKKISNTTYNGRMTIILLEAALSWSRVWSLLAFYAPKSGAENMPFPISEDDLQHVIQRVENFGDTGCKEALNKFSLHRTKINLIREPQARLTGLVGEMQNFWLLILQDYPELVSLLTLDQLMQLTSFFLAQMITHSESSFQKLQDLLRQETLEENKRFVIVILCQIFIEIGSLAKQNMTTDIVARINIVNILEAESDDAIPALDSNKLIKDVPVLSTLHKDEMYRIEKYLHALLCLPIRHLGISLRTMTFVITYVIERSCQHHERIKTLCNNILFESLEEGGLNVLEYIDLDSLVPNLPRNKVLQKAFELSLRNVKTLSGSPTLLTLSSCPDESISTVLSCIENVKQKTNKTVKLTLDKVEKKLGKRALKTCNENIESAEEVKKITMALKISLGKNSVKENLKKSVSSMLRSAFMNGVDVSSKEENYNNDREDFIEKALELAIIALQHRSYLELPDEIVAGIWSTVLKYPQTKLLTILLEATTPKVFNEVLMSLHRQTEMELYEPDAIKLNNTLVIWNCIEMSDMGTSRNKSRQHATRKLMRMLLILEIRTEHWPDVLKLLQVIVNSKHMQLFGEFIDMIISIATRSIREGNSLLECDNVLILCLSLLRSRVEMMTDRLPLLLQLFRQAVTFVSSQAKKESTANSHLLGLCALNVEKVTSALCKLKRHMERLSPYLISDMVDVFAKGDLEPIKEPFQNCINKLLSICDPHGVALNYRALPAAKREIFKNMSDTYNKFHRFTGKI